MSLPRVGRRSASERPADLAKRSVEDEAKTTEVAAGAQKAAAWQWYARGVGEVVLPTKRPTTHVTPRSVIDDSGRKAGDQHTVPEKHLEAQLAASPTGVSRFKAEVSSFAGKINGGPQPSPPLSAVTPPAPLYDEFDLSGLRLQMADFVQHLQQEKPKGRDQRPAGKVSEGTKSLINKSPAHCTAPQGRRSVVSDPPAATPVSSTDHLLTPRGPPAAAAKAGGGSVAASSADHQSTKSSMPVNSLMPFSTRPFSVLHRLFRAVVSGSFLKSSKTSTITRNPPIPGAMHHPEMLACEGEDPQYKYHHHYIHHHHHHHYYYAKSPEESAPTLHSRRRHSESSCICPRIPSILEAESDEEEEEEEEVERNPIDGFPARCRRRHSHSFVLHPTSKEADFNWEICVKEETEKAALMLPLRSPRRFNSERFSPNKIPSIDSQELQAWGRNDFQERLLDIKSRRFSADQQSCRPDVPELAGLEKRLSRGGGKTGRGTYKLGGGEEGAMPVAAHALCRRRHSEGFQVQQKEADRSDQMEKNIPNACRQQAADAFVCTFSRNVK